MELLEENSVGKTKLADVDALQDPIALQLFKNQVSHDLASLGGEKTELKKQVLSSSMPGTFESRFLVCNHCIPGVTESVGHTSFRVKS